MSMEGASTMKSYLNTHGQGRRSQKEQNMTKITESKKQEITGHERNVNKHVSIGGIFFQTIDNTIIFCRFAASLFHISMALIVPISRLTHD